jgi:5-methylcytosine-specific restriction endonuclease McrA
VKRDWTAAREKVETEAQCRVCDIGGVQLDAAHIIPRSVSSLEGSMDALNIVSLCRRCHTAYDSHELDLLPYLTVDEQAHACKVARGLESARQIITGERGHYPRAAA